MKDIICPVCNGSAQDYYSGKPCEECNGYGLLHINVLIGRYKLHKPTVLNKNKKTSYTRYRKDSN